MHKTLFKEDDIERLYVSKKEEGKGRIRRFKEDEMITHIVRKYSKVAQKESKTRHDWVGKVIH